MSILKWEALLEKNIEGFFNKKFASDLQFAEIEKYVEREMQLKKKKINGEYYIPNVYSIYMGDADYQRICPAKLLDKLYARAIGMTIRHDWLIAEKLRIEFRKDMGLKKGSCAVKSDYNTVAETGIAAPHIEAHTIILEQPCFAKALELPIEHKAASLLVVAGPDRESYLELPGKQVHIGRREENEFLLTDRNSSRMHAYVAFENYRHVLYDAGSLNGTYVNGERITVQRLRTGDEIQIGNTIILYEVI